MPVKPSPEVIGAAEAMKKNPLFGHDCLEAVINETPELRDALVSAGLVEEIKEN